MKLVNLLRNRNILINVRYQRRDSSTRTVKKSVIVSQSHDIYTNLALEDWFYKNYDFTNEHMLMLWTNNPCVVIGKFQNPWLECNVPQLDTLTAEGVRLARRNSGGGTVYHDRGNLNLTFFTPRDDYKRKHNLQMITNAISRRFDLNIDISDREDLVFGEFKVSGTAAKLSRTIAYHHCTLLVDADEETLSKSLRKPGYLIRTNATQSIPSEIKNLADLNGDVNVDELIGCVSEEYLSSAPYVKEKSGVNLIVEDGMKYVHPSEDAYPGILDIRDELKSFDWVFGKCPAFDAKKGVVLENNAEITITLKVEKGIVHDIHLEAGNDILNFDPNVERFTDRKFHENIFNELVDSLNTELVNVNLRSPIKGLI